eukprot:7736897-Karenia_brevis.AAC.1
MASNLGVQGAPTNELLAHFVSLGSKKAPKPPKMGPRRLPDLPKMSPRPHENLDLSLLWRSIFDNFLVHVVVAAAARVAAALVLLLLLMHEARISGTVAGMARRAVGDTYT